MKKNRILLVIASLLILSSCDPSGDYQYWVENYSDSTVFVEYKELYNDTVFVKEINAKEKILIKESSSINGLYDYKEDFLNRYFEKFKIYADSLTGTELKKDPGLRINWNYDTETTGSFGRSGINMYTFNVQDTDL